MKIAVRSPNWIGDGVMALPALKALRYFFPEAKLTVVVKSYLADLFRGQIEIDEIMPLPDNLSLPRFLSTARNLRACSFDRGLLFTNSFKSALLFRIAGINQLAGYKADGRSLLLNPSWPRPTGNFGHHSWYYLRLVENFAGGKVEKEIPAKIRLKPEELDSGRLLLRELGIPDQAALMAIAPAAAYGPAKAWPADRFKTVISSLLVQFPGLQVLIMGSTREKDLCTDMAAGFTERVFDLSGKVSLRETIILVNFCRLLLGNDSGLMHVAAALSIPTVAIFGPTLPESTSPLGKDHLIIHHPPACAPCKKRICPEEHACMTAVTTKEVLDAVLQVLPR